MSEYLYAGLTSQTLDVMLYNSSTGAAYTGLAYNTSGLKAYYRKGATGTMTAITLATQTVGGAFSSGGFVEIDSTNAQGLYRLDVPNAMVDTEGFVTLYIYGATNLAPCVLRVDCRPLPVDVKKVAGTVQTAGDLAANQVIIIDGIGYTLAQVQGAVSSPQTSTPVYATSFNGSTYTVTHTGVTSTGVRGTATRAKT